MNLRTAIQTVIPGWNGKVCAHVMPWYGDGNVHRNVPYKSNDKYVIAKQLELMQSVGIDTVILTWQGIIPTFQHSTAQEMVVQCGEREMGFMLLLDPWCANLPNTTNKTTNVINSLKDPTTQDILNAPAYVPEKYVLDFSTGADVTALSNNFPNLKFLKENVGFSWPMIPWNADVYKQCNQLGDMKIPGVCIGFNDAGEPRADGSRDYSRSVWGGPTRVLDTQAGNFFNSQLKTLVNSYEQSSGPPVNSYPYVAIVTWNDYDEQSSGPLEAYVAALNGTSF